MIVESLSCVWVIVLNIIWRYDHLVPADLFFLLQPLQSQIANINSVSRIPSFAPNCDLLKLGEPPSFVNIFGDFSHPQGYSRIMKACVYVILTDCWVNMQDVSRWWIYMDNMYSLVCLQCVKTDRMSTGSWPCQLVLRFNLIVQMFLKKRSCFLLYVQLKLNKSYHFFFYFCDWILHFAGVCAVCVEQLRADHKNNTTP